MTNIQPFEALDNSTPSDTPKVPDGWAKVPHSVARDSTISRDARLLWVILEGRQGQHAHARVGLKVLAADMGVSTRSVRTWLTELTTVGLLSVKRTGRTNMYTALKQVERGQQLPIRVEACFHSTEQETLRNKKAGQAFSLPLAWLPPSPRSLEATTHTRSDNLKPAAASSHSLQIELFLNGLGQYFPQIPAPNRRVSETLAALFSKGWQAPELIAELRESITNPQAGAGLIVTELERLAAMPRQESHTATLTRTRAERQLEELQEAWGVGIPQQELEQEQAFYETAQEGLRKCREAIGRKAN